MVEVFVSVFVLVFILFSIVGTIKANRNLQQVTTQALKEIEDMQAATQSLRESAPEPDVVVTVDKDGNVWHSRIVDKLSTDEVVSILPGGKDKPKPRKPDDRGRRGFDTRTMWD